MFGRTIEGCCVFYLPSLLRTFIFNYKLAIILIGKTNKSKLIAFKLDQNLNLKYNASIRTIL